jgi:hypothetical protein
MAVASRPPIGASRNALEAWLAAAVTTNAALRDNILRNTHATLEQLVGRKVPGDVKVTAIEELPTDLYIVRRFEGATEPVEAEGTETQILRSSIHAIAMDEEGFWEKLAGDPKTVLAERLALRLPPEVKVVHVLDETANNAYLVLHHAPHLQAWQPPPAIRQKIAVKK